jgi:hypothetical protein
VFELGRITRGTVTASADANETVARDSKTDSTIEIVERIAFLLRARSQDDLINSLNRVVLCGHLKNILNAAVL